MDKEKQIIKELRLIKVELMELNHTLEDLRDTQLHIEQEKRRLQLWGKRIEDLILRIEKKNNIAAGGLNILKPKDRLQKDFTDIKR